MIEDWMHQRQEYFINRVCLWVGLTFKSALGLPPSQIQNRDTVLGLIALIEVGLVAYGLF
jgi:hypothetical protein